MKKMTNACAAVLLIALNLTICSGQEVKASKAEATTTKFYRLDFVIKEVEDSRVINSRSYSAIVATDSGSSLRTGTRVPYSTASEIHYLDIGVDIDTRRLKDLGNEIETNVSADISSIAPETQNASPPVVRHNRWDSVVVLPLRKPTVVFSSDDLTSKHKMQFEVTVTPVG